MSALGAPAAEPRRALAPVLFVAAALAALALVGTIGTGGAPTARKAEPGEQRIAVAANTPLRAALLKAGLAPDDADLAVNALADQVDVQRAPAGLSLEIGRAHV